MSVLEPNSHTALNLRLIEHVEAALTRMVRDAARRFAWSALHGNSLIFAEPGVDETELGIDVYERNEFGHDHDLEVCVWYVNAEPDGPMTGTARDAGGAEDDFPDWRYTSDDPGDRERTLSVAATLIATVLVFGTDSPPAIDLLALLSEG